jgi:hypothetical protein
MQGSIAEYVRIKKSALPLQFKKTLGLIPSLDNEFIKGFALFMHPSADYIVGGGKCTIFTKKDTYIYTLFNKEIIRTAVASQKKVIYLR